jgi:hypothetical protein
MNPAMREQAKLSLSRGRMELSGWDGEGNFFVVHARLAALGDGELFAELKPKVHAGAKVFARPLAGTENGGNVPAVYRVLGVEDRGTREPGGVRLALLKPARPFPQLERHRP